MLGGSSDSTSSAKANGKVAAFQVVASAQQQYDSQLDMQLLDVES